MDVIRRNPTATPLALTFALSLAGLGLGPGGGPSFVSSTALVTTILIYMRSHELQKYLTQWSILTLSITLSHSKASLSALSSPSMSILVLSLLSSVSALFALIPIFLTHTVSSKLPTNYHILVFPTFWTLMWLLVSRVSPVGRLLTWTPLTGTSSYTWILPILGLPGLDLISALWASTAAEYMYDVSDDGISKDQVLLPDFAPRAERKTTNSQKRLFSSLTFLLALTIPSFITTSLPPPPHSDAPAHVPLSVSCVLPPPLSSASTKPQLEQFIDETKAYSSRSQVMLWPEGAVTFESEAARNQGLDLIKQDVFDNGTRGNLWVGVSFLQRVAGDGKTGTRDGMYRNGMTLVGPEGVVEFTYYKRNLVPIAESFSQLPSSIAPPLYTIEPKIKKTKEIVTLTTSICLDFSSPLFPGNDEMVTTNTRPSLILAPARTWDTQVGQAMYSLARVRAKEIGAELLWCDGGAGGLSGVGDDIQVGWGSWSKDIGVPNENSEDSSPNATLYATFGDFGVIVVMLGLWGAASVVFISGFSIERLSITQDIVRQAVNWIRQNATALWVRARERLTGNRSTAPLLIQIDDEEERLI